jgi:hypothetical protein
LVGRRVLDVKWILGKFKASKLDKLQG